MIKNIGKDMFSLGVIQVAGYILPLLSLPYLTRYLGTGEFGKYSIIFSTLTIMNVFGDYGYAINGVRKVSIAALNREKISEIVGTSTSVRLILSLIAFSVFCITSSLFVKIDVYTYIIVLLSSIANGLVASWLFQGLGKILQFSFFNLVVRTLSVSLVVLLVRSPKDLDLAIFLNTVPQILGVFYMFFFLKKSEIPWKIERRTNILKNEFVEGIFFFLPNLYSIFFTNFGIVALGIFQPSGVVGIYSAHDRIVKAASSLSGILNQVFYPIVASRMHNSHFEGMSFIIRIAKLSIPIFIAITLILIFKGDDLVKIIFGSHYLSKPSIMLYLPVYILLANVNTFIGVMYMTTTGNEKEYSKAFLLGTVFAIILYIVLPRFISYHAPAVGLVFGEFIIFAYLFYVVIRGKRKSV